MATGGELPVSGDNLSRWITELGKPQYPISLNILAERLREEPDPYKMAELMQLPVPLYTNFGSPENLLTDVNSGLEPFRQRGISNYYVGLRPLKPELPKHRNANQPMSIDQIEPYIRGCVSPDQYPDYVLRVAEYAVMDFGIVCIVNPGGSKQLDIIIGDIDPLATGLKRPNYQARTNPFTGVLRYTRVKPEWDGSPSPLDDRRDQILYHPIITPGLRTVIGDFVGQIPRLDDGVNALQWPGRYEIALVRHDDGITDQGSLVALCLDAKPDLGGKHPFALPEEPLYYTYGERAN